MQNILSNWTKKKVKTKNIWLIVSSHNLLIILFNPRRTRLSLVGILFFKSLHANNDKFKGTALFQIINLSKESLILLLHVNYKWYTLLTKFFIKIILLNQFIWYINLQTNGIEQGTLPPASPPKQIIFSTLDHLPPSLTSSCPLLLYFIFYFLKKIVP